MAEMVTVPTAKIAELLGLDPGTDEITIRRALADWIAKNDTSQRVAAARRDDERIVNAALSQGKFAASRRDFYLAALREDPVGARRVIKILEPVPFIAAANATSTHDPELDRVSALITGHTPEEATQPPTAVWAAAQPAPAWGRADQPTVTTPEQLNVQIEADAGLHRASWAIGGRGGGLKPPPEQITSYPEIEHSWAPKPKLVVNDDGTGHWEPPKPPPLSAMFPGVREEDVDRNSPWNSPQTD